MPARNGSAGDRSPGQLRNLLGFLVPVFTAVSVLWLPWIRGDPERPIYFVSILLFGMSAFGARLPVSISSLVALVRGVANRKLK